MPHDVDNPDSLDFALMRQREYERRMNLMQISRDPAQMDQIALDAASMIEDILRGVHLAASPCGKHRFKS